MAKQSDLYKLIEGIKKLGLVPGEEDYFTTLEISNGCGLSRETVRDKIRMAMFDPDVQVDTIKKSVIGISGLRSLAPAYRIRLKKDAKKGK